MPHGVLVPSMVLFRLVAGETLWEQVTEQQSTV